MNKPMDPQRERKKNVLRRQVINGGPDSEEEYQAKLKAHRKKNWLIILGILLAAAVVCGAYWIIDSIRNLSTYSTEWSIELENGEAANTGFEAFGGGVLKYGKSGASYIRSDGAQVWSEAYEMQSPFAVVRGEYALIGDLNSNNLAVFSETGGKLCQVTTPGPIMRASVAGQGMAAVLVQDGLSDSILFYDKTGQRLEIEVKTSFAEDGYPLDIALSENGKILVYSYVNVEDGEVKAKVNFYNFGEEGQKYQDRLVGTFKYDDAVIPRVHVMENDAAVAFGDHMISFYSLKKVDEPSRLDEDRQFENGIRLIFYNEKYVGVIEAGKEEKDPGVLHVYKSTGDEVLNLELNQEYEKGVFAGDEVLLYNSGSCELITMGGHTRFQGKIDGGIDSAFKGEKRNQLLIAGGGKISSCILK